MNEAENYDTARRRIIELVRGAGPDGPDASVEACPGWTVGDLVGHLGGGLGDFKAGNFGAGEYADFGERTVHERRGWSLDDKLAEWDTHRAGADALFESPMANILVAEVVSHEHDIRTALGRPGAREDPSVRAALDRPLREVDRKMRDQGAPALRLVMDDEETVLGDGPPAGTLHVSAFELLRTIGGRRSRAQVRALEWDGEPEPWLDVLTPFGALRAADLDE